MAATRSPRPVPSTSARKLSQRNLSALLVSPVKSSSASLMMSVAGSISEGLAQHRPISGSITLREDEMLLIITLHAERIIPAHNVEASFRDNVLDLYEPTTLGFISFEPINSAEGKRLADHLHRLRKGGVSPVERAAALHGAAFGRHLIEMTWQQFDRTAQKLREGAELLPASARSAAPANESKDAECMRLADDIVRYLRSAKEAKEKEAKKEKEEKEKKKREKEEKKEREREKEKEEMKDKDKERERRHTMAASPSGDRKEKKEKERRERSKTTDSPVATPDKGRRRTKSSAGLVENGPDADAVVLASKIAEYKDNSQATAGFLRVIAPKSNFTLLESFFEAVTSTEADRAARHVHVINTSSNLAQSLAVHLARREAALSPLPFRSNSPAFMIIHMRRIAAPFLSLALKGPMAQYFEAPKPVEVDPQRLSSSANASPTSESRATASRNVQNLRNITRIFLESIYKAVDTLPTEFAEMAQVIKQEAEKRGMKSANMLSTLIFLRFICPTLVAPDTYGLIPVEKIPSGCRRGLILISKLVQMAANDSESGGHKEDYMAPFTEFLAQHAAPVHAFVTSLPTVSGSRQISGSRLLLNPPLPTPEELSAAVASLHALFISTLPQMEAIDSASRSYLERLLNEMGPPRRVSEPKPRR